MRTKKLHLPRRSASRPTSAPSLEVRPENTTPAYYRVVVVDDLPRPRSVRIERIT